MSGPERSRATEAYLDAAVDLLGKLGPAGGGRRLHLYDVESVSGVSRSTLRRMWPTVHAMADDVRVHAACGRPDWHQGLCAVDPALPWETALTAAVRRTASLSPVLHRAALRAVPASPTAAALRRWEQLQLARVERWVAAHLLITGTVPVGDLTVADLTAVLAALVEGTLYGEAVGEAPATVVPRAAPARIGRAVARAVTELVAPDREARPRRPVSIGPAVGPPTQDGRLLPVLDTVVRRAEEARFGVVGGPQPTRLVDVTEVARTLGVTTRRVQMVWPTTTDQNADVAEHVVRRVRERAEGRHRQALREALAALSAAPPSADRDEVVAPVFVRMVRDLLLVGLVRSRAGPLAASLALADPVVADRVHTELDAWQEGQAALFMASMQLLGIRLDPALDAADYGGAVFAGLTGGLLLGRLHPTLAEEQVTVVGERLPLLGLGALALARGMEEGPPRTDAATWFHGPVR